MSSVVTLVLDRRTEAERWKCSQVAGCTVSADALDTAAIVHQISLLETQLLNKNY